MLIRHGRPLLTTPFLNMPSHLKAYDEAAIDTAFSPPKKLFEQLTSVQSWFCSPLPRAQQSLELLAPSVQPVISDLFCEAPLPAREKPRFLPLSFWLAFLRGRWMQGRLSASESYSQCLQRAEAAADFILDYIKTDENAALMGHGFFNLLLSNALKKKGWKQTHSGKGYWSLQRLAKR